VLLRINVTRGVFANFQIVKRNWNASLVGCPWRIIKNCPVIVDRPRYVIPLLKLAISFMLFLDFSMVAPGGGGSVKIVPGLHPYLDVSIVSDMMPSKLVLTIVWNVSGASPNFSFPHLEGDFSFILHGKPGAPRIEIEVVVSLKSLLTPITDFCRNLRILPRWWRKSA
jgi:hypothetical protein